MTTEQAPTTAADSEKKFEEVKVKKVIVNPNENAQAFVDSISKSTTKRVAYQTLDWANKLIGNNNAQIPGAEKQATTPKDFMGYVKDGVMLAKLANVLSPGSVETVHESQEKEKQTANISGFLNFIKDKAGIPLADTVKAEDVQAGKTSAFSGILGSLVTLGGQAVEKFSAGQGLDLDSFVKLAQDYIPKSFLQQLLALKDRLFKPRQQAVAHADKKGEEPKAENDIPNADAESPEVKAQA
jgi:hypothetical protein